MVKTIEGGEAVASELNFNSYETTEKEVFSFDSGIGCLTVISTGVQAFCEGKEAPHVF